VTLAADVSCTEGSDKPTCRGMETDNTSGKLLFAIVREIQKRRFARRAVLRMVLGEQRNGAVTDRSMSMVMWDMLTGSAAYRDIFLRTLHLAFWVRFLWELGLSLCCKPCRTVCVK
jgi:hypothetical protein